MLFFVIIPQKNRPKKSGGTLFVILLFFGNALIFRSPRGRGKGKSLGELIDEILRGTIPNHVGKIQNFQVGIHKQERRSVHLLFVEEIDNRLL